MSADAEKNRRAIRSYVVRTGRATESQQRALVELWPRYGIDFESGAASPLDLAHIFGREAPRVLEIGFGNGDNLIELAAANPQSDFLGAEVHPPGVGHALRLAQQRDLHNLRIVRHDAVELLRHGISPDALSGAVVLFPDPWHKKRHHKRRLLQRPFFDLLATCMRPGAMLAIATDWVPYAEEVLATLNAHPAFKNATPGGGWADRPAWRVRTRFERRGERLGHAVHDLLFTRVQ
jgi:tRNA (guanine-N7-)-methyltransferase